MLCVVCQDEPGCLSNGVCQHYLCVRCYVHHYRCPGVSAMDELTYSRVSSGFQFYLKTCPICRKFEADEKLVTYLQTSGRTVQQQSLNLMESLKSQPALTVCPPITPASRVRLARCRGFGINVRNYVFWLCEKFVTCLEYVASYYLDVVFETLGQLVKAGAFGRIWGGRDPAELLVNLERVRMRIGSMWNRFEQQHRGISRMRVEDLSERVLTKVERVYEKYNLPSKARNQVMYLVLCELVWRGAFPRAPKDPLKEFQYPKPTTDTVKYAAKLHILGEDTNLSIPPTMSVYSDQYWIRVPHAKVTATKTEAQCPFSGCQTKLSQSYQWVAHFQTSHPHDIICPWCRQTITLRVGEVVNKCFRFHMCEAMVACFVCV